MALEEQMTQADTKVHSDKDSTKSASSHKSSSSDLEYQSSSAESLERANSERKSSSRSPSRSRSRSRQRSRSRSFTRYERRNTVIYKDHRRLRPYGGKFRREFYGDRSRFKFGHPRFANNRFNRKYQNFHSPSTFEERKRFRENSLEKKASSKLSKDGSNTPSKESPKVYKPSEIKENAKQQAQSFLAMLEEKKKSTFSPNLVQTVEIKKIPVKIHGFVNTFNSLNNSLNDSKNNNFTNNKESQHGSKSKGNKRIVSLYSSDELEADHKKMSYDSSNNHNSSREEGEITSDYEGKMTKRKTKKASSSNSDNSNHSSGKKKKAKKRKQRKKKRTRSSSSSSSSSSTSSSSSPSSSTSSSSESDSSDSSYSSSSSSSYSSDFKKKSSKKRISKRRDKKKRKLEKGSLRKQKKNKGKDLKFIITNGKTNIENSDENFIEGENSHIKLPELLNLTKTEPQIQFCINPKYSLEEFRQDMAIHMSEKINSQGAVKSKHEKFNEQDRSLKKEKSKTKHRAKGETSDSLSESCHEKRAKLPMIGKMKGLNKKGRVKSLAGPLESRKVDMNYDYNYYYQYYYSNGYPHMEPSEQHSAASLGAYYQMMNSYDYSQQQLAQWTNQKGFTLLETSKYDQMITVPDNVTSDNSFAQNAPGDTIPGEPSQDGQVKRDVEENNNLNQIQVVTTNTTSSSVSGDFVKFDLSSKLYSNGIHDECQVSPKLKSPPPSPPPLRPRMTFLEATESITLPSGVILPPGTKQIIVHPYNRPVY